MKQKDLCMMLFVFLPKLWKILEQFMEEVSIWKNIEHILFIEV